jgi:hypothetical protein
MVAGISVGMDMVMGMWVFLQWFDVINDKTMP